MINKKLKGISYEAAAQAWPSCIVNEGNALFKQQYRNVKFGFSTFCGTKPRNAVRAAASGTHGGAAH